MQFLCWHVDHVQACKNNIIEQKMSSCMFFQINQQQQQALCFMLRNVLRYMVINAVREKKSKRQVDEIFIAILLRFFISVLQKKKYCFWTSVVLK